MIIKKYRIQMYRDGARAGYADFTTARAALECLRAGWKHDAKGAANNPTVWIICSDGDYTRISDAELITAAKKEDPRAVTAEPRKIVQVKNGRMYETCSVETDPVSVYQSLANDLIMKKLNGAACIVSIRRVTNYDNTQNITVCYSNATRAIYTVSE